MVVGKRVMGLWTYTAGVDVRCDMPLSLHTYLTYLQLPVWCVLDIAARSAVLKIGAWHTYPGP